LSTFLFRARCAFDEALRVADERRRFFGFFDIFVSEKMGDASPGDGPAIAELG